MGAHDFSILYKIEKLSIFETVAGIGESAFSSCSALKELVIPDGVMEIGESAFMGSGLRRVKFPAGLTELSNGIFFHCDDPGQMPFGNVESFSRSTIRAVRSKEGKFFLARETFPCTMLR